MKNILSKKRYSTTFGVDPIFIGRGGTRTHDQRFRKPLLYPLSYTPQFLKAYLYRFFLLPIKKIFYLPRF